MVSGPFLLRWGILLTPALTCHGVAHVLRTGEHLVPDAALEALADQGIPFAVMGKTTYDQQMAEILEAFADRATIGCPKA
jgi:hypothetical protein